jgi:SAM-dependent methyltransferase
VTEENAWLRILAKDPEHSERYVQRFRTLAARGRDLGGEARFVDTMLPRQARVLDAGCGTGRVGGILAANGHRVVGVDLDPRLIAEARADHPGAEWIVGDLSELGLPGAFHVVVCAGNVMTFVAPSTRVEILRRFRAHLVPGGRIVAGFGAGREYEFDDFLADAKEAGLVPDHLFSTWDLRPFGPESPFLVAVLSLA